MKAVNFYEIELQKQKILELTMGLFAVACGIMASAAMFLG